jgi:Mo-dependent nitrogenase C-terminus
MNNHHVDTTNILTVMGSNLSIDSHYLSKFDIFKPLRYWLENFNVANPQLAHKLCQSIPAQCPFEREIKLFGRKLFHIPPMCKLNPLYEEVVFLRFRAMCYLADECGEDISMYC